MTREERAALRDVIYRELLQVGDEACELAMRIAGLIENAEGALPKGKLKKATAAHNRIKDGGHALMNLE